MSSYFFSPQYFCGLEEVAWGYCHVLHLIFMYQEKIVCTTAACLKIF